jgi:hypothetical protein
VVAFGVAVSNTPRALAVLQAIGVSAVVVWWALVRLGAAWAVQHAFASGFSFWPTVLAVTACGCVAAK